MEHMNLRLITFAETYGPRLVGALLLLFVGWWLVGVASRHVVRGLEKTEIDATLRPLIAQVVRMILLVVLLLTVLGTVGVQTGSLIAVLGAAGLAIGLALQGTLSNVASGVVLLMQRPFEVGDTVNLDGNFGTVTSIGLIATEFRTPDGLYMMMPNSKVWGSNIRNLNRNPVRRVELVIGISYGDDIDRAIAIVERVIAADSRVLADPAPLVAVGELGDSSVDLWIRPWTKTADWFSTTLDLRKGIKQAFDAEGISIPFPQRDVHMIAPDQAA